MEGFGRRRFIASGGALAAVGLAGRAVAQAPRKISFITPFGYLVGYAPTLNAQAGGHFAKEGLEVEMLPGKGSAVAVQQVIAGRALPLERWRTVRTASSSARSAWRVVRRKRRGSRGRSQTRFPTTPRMPARSTALATAPGYQAVPDSRNAVVP